MWGSPSCGLWLLVPDDKAHASPGILVHSLSSSTREAVSVSSKITKRKQTNKTYTGQFSFLPRLSSLSYSLPTSSPIPLNEAVFFLPFFLLTTASSTPFPVLFLLTQKSEACAVSQECSLLPALYSEARTRDLVQYLLLFST